MTTNKRKAIPKKTRFEVFKRDSFTCQYCGAKAPDVVLHVDHINPVSKGGTNDMMNLVSSCQSCNSGKGAVRLDDSSALAKRRGEAERRQDRLDQLEMLHQWHMDLQSMLETEVRMAEELLLSPTYMIGFSITDHGRDDIRKLISRFGISEVMESIRISLARYIRVRDGKATRESVEESINRIGGVCYNRRRDGGA